MAPNGPIKFCAGRFGGDTWLKGIQEGRSFGAYEINARKSNVPVPRRRRAKTSFHAVFLKVRATAAHSNPRESPFNFIPKDKERRFTNRRGQAGGLESAPPWSSASRILDSLQLGHRSAPAMVLDAGRSACRSPSGAKADRALGVRFPAFLLASRTAGRLLCDVLCDFFFAEPVSRWRPGCSFSAAPASVTRSENCRWSIQPKVLRTTPLIRMLLLLLNLE